MRQPGFDAIAPDPLRALVAGNAGAVRCLWTVENKRYPGKKGFLNRSPMASSCNANFREFCKTVSKSPSATSFDPTQHSFAGPWKFLLSGPTATRAIIRGQCPKTFVFAEASPHATKPSGLLARHGIRSSMRHSLRVHEAVYAGFHVANKSDSSRNPVSAGPQMGD